MRVVFRSDNGYSTLVSAYKSILRLRHLGYAGPIDFVYVVETNPETNPSNDEKIAKIFTKALPGVTMIPLIFNKAATTFTPVVRDHAKFRHPYERFTDIPPATITISTLDVQPAGCDYFTLLVSGILINLSLMNMDFLFLHDAAYLRFPDGCRLPINPDFRDALSYSDDELGLADVSSMDEFPWLSVLAVKDQPYDSLVMRGVTSRLKDNAVIERLVEALCLRIKATGCSVLLFHSDHEAGLELFEKLDQVVVLGAVLPSADLKIPKDSIVVIQVPALSNSAFKMLRKLTTLPYCAEGPSAVEAMREEIVVLRAVGGIHPEEPVAIYKKAWGAAGQLVARASECLRDLSQSDLPLQMLMASFERGASVWGELARVVKMKWDRRPDQLGLALTYISQRPKCILPPREALALMRKTYCQFVSFLFPKELTAPGFDAWWKVLAPGEAFPPRSRMQYALSPSATLALGAITSPYELLYFAAYLELEPNFQFTKFHGMLISKLATLAHFRLDNISKAFMVTYLKGVIDFTALGQVVLRTDFFMLGLLFIFDKDQMLMHVPDVMRVFQESLQADSFERPLGINPVYAIIIHQFLKAYNEPYVNQLFSLEQQVILDDYLKQLSREFEPRYNEGWAVVEPSTSADAAGETAMTFSSLLGGDGGAVAAMVAAAAAARCDR